MLRAEKGAEHKKNALPQEQKERIKAATEKGIEKQQARFGKDGPSTLG